MSHHRSYAATTSPFSDITCACAHYLLLRFLPLVPSLFPSGKRPRKNQGRTKDEPKNAKSQNVRFLKIAVSFPSLIPCLIPPRDDRENTERRATELLAYEKCCLLRLLPKEVISIPKKVVPIPKKVDSFPKTIDYFSKNIYSIPKKIYSLLRILYSSLISFHTQ